MVTLQFVQIMPEEEIIDFLLSCLSSCSVDEFSVLKQWVCNAVQIQYTDAMKAYHNSTAYQSWIAAKGKVDVDAETEEPEKTRRNSVSWN